MSAFHFKSPPPTDVAGCSSTLQTASLAAETQRGPDPLNVEIRRLPEKLLQHLFFRFRLFYTRSLEFRCWVVATSRWIAPSKSKAFSEAKPGFGNESCSQAHGQLLTPARQRPGRSNGLTGGGDLVRSYRATIGRVPLLSHGRRITLGRQVQDLMRLEKWSRNWKSARSPSRVRWSGPRPLGLSQPVPQAQAGLRRRAKERNGGANPCALVVSVAKKKYNQAEHGACSTLDPGGHDRLVRGV